MFEDDKEIIHDNRHFNEDDLTKDLLGKDLDQVIDMFEKRIRGWYIKPTSIFLHKKFLSKADFLLINICCIIIDLLSQYDGDYPHSKGVYFRRFLKKYLIDFKQLLDPNKKIKYFDVNGNFIDAYVRNIRIGANQKKDLSWVFYNAFRNGIVHNGMVLSYGRHNRADKNKIVKIDYWGSSLDYIEITINPELLFINIVKLFKKYFEKLRKSKTLLKRFQNKFYRDFGWKTHHFIPTAPRG